MVDAILYSVVRDYRATLPSMAIFPILSLVIVVKLDSLVLPASNRSWDRIPIENLLKEGSI